jgi:hypothetical protein
MITEPKLPEIEAKHPTDPIRRWYDRASNGYWDFAGRVADYFLQTLRRVNSSNPFIAIAKLMFVFIAGFIIVTPLYMILGPLVQLAIVIVAVVWTCLAALFFRWRHRSAGQLASSIEAKGFVSRDKFRPDAVRLLE